MTEPVHGVVIEWGGGLIHVLVDRETFQYLEGRVVIIPETLWTQTTTTRPDTGISEQ